MTTHREKAAHRTSKNVERNQRIAEMLVSVLGELHGGCSPRVTLVLIRGVALQAQQLRLAPAAFDCPNGRDALAAVVMSVTLDHLKTLANSNAFVLGSRWSKIVYIAGLEIPGPALGAIERNRAADIPMSNTNIGWVPAKLFGRLTP